MVLPARRQSDVAYHGSGSDADHRRNHRTCHPGKQIRAVRRAFQALSGRSIAVNVFNHPWEGELSMRQSRIRATGFGVIAAIGLIGCATAGPDFVVALPNGYQIKRDKADQPMLVKRTGGVVVPGPVEKYTVLRDVVTGFVPEPQAQPDGKARKASKAKPGYFILRTRTGELSTGLSESEWAEQLQGLGVKAEPKDLSPPVLPK